MKNSKVFVHVVRRLLPWPSSVLVHSDLPPLLWTYPSSPLAGAIPRGCCIPFYQFTHSLKGQPQCAWSLMNKFVFLSPSLQESERLTHQTWVIFFASVIGLLVLFTAAVCICRCVANKRRNKRSNNNSNNKRINNNSYRTEDFDEERGDSSSQEKLG